MADEYEKLWLDLFAILNQKRIWKKLGLCSPSFYFLLNNQLIAFSQIPTKDILLE